MPSPEAQPPIVYVETNWLVALVLLHDHHHRGALELFCSAMQDECEIRIPYGTFLEAHSCARADMDNRPQELAQLKGLLSLAYQHGVEELGDAVHALDHDKVESYFRRQPQPLLEALEANPKPNKLHDARRELEVMSVLRPMLNFTKEDRFDLYVLASIIVDRQQSDQTRPAVFCSIDTGEFGPSTKAGAKMPTGVYDRWSLYWQGDFRWRAAVGEWRGKFLHSA